MDALDLNRVQSLKFLTILEAIWCIIIVDDSGLLDLTQRFASANCGSGQQAQPPAQWVFGHNGVSMSYQGTSDESHGEHAFSSSRNPFQSGIKHAEPQQQLNFASEQNDTTPSKYDLLYY